MAKLSNQQIKDQFSKARQAQVQGRLDEAERGYKRLLKAVPNLAEVNFNLAEVLVLRGKMADASVLFEAALKLRPSEPAIWISYLNMASKHPNPKNFDILRTRAKPALGKMAEFSFFEGLAAFRKKEWDRSASFFAAAIDGGFRQFRVYLEYGSVLVELRKFDLALEQFNRAQSLAPDNDMILFKKAGLFLTMGKMDEARATAVRGMEIAPKVSGHYAQYVAVTKMKADDPVIPKMKSVLKQMRASDPNLPALGFSLAKAMEDTGQYDRVFSYLKQANDASAKAYPYDVKAVEQLADKIRDLYDRLAPLDVTTSDASPIFVTGAPRSGTTLVEQILASHSQVSGGGELGIVQPKISDVLTSNAASGAISDASILEKCAQFTSEFERELQKLFPGVPHVSDKSISSYAILGFLAKLMPNARFVVVRRDPRDNALSIYKNQFKDGLHRYSNKLEHIAAFLRQFEELVEFWRDRCPDAFYEIRYEELIADPEDQSRALVKAAGLEWEDACLSFYETKRDVKTLSATQVRQPMYSSSVGAWKKFEADMQPFLKAYGENEVGRK
ncbi:MAG: sulfotransferase [Litoreibacter sp.]|uniref:tetratricopeptide repeat-containing sulfotransferase family protein n=1 Tax=Litoreibacter sp. TaxID=1969459 RepID=UPI00329788B0